MRAYLLLATVLLGSAAVSAQTNSFPTNANAVVVSPYTLTVNTTLYAGAVQSSAIALSYADAFTYEGNSQPHYGVRWILDTSYTGGPSLWQSAYGGMKFFTKGQARTCITAFGNVGIGTMNPQSLLAVAGTITTQGITVTQTGWSDFVFDPAYTLRPLQDVENYIRLHHHLPDVPSTKDVDANGLDLAAMQKLQMQKIEELTLYLIEDRREIDSLRREVAELRRQNR